MFSPPGQALSLDDVIPDVTELVHRDVSTNTGLDEDDNSLERHEATPTKRRADPRLNRDDGRPQRRELLHLNVTPPVFLDDRRGCVTLAFAFLLQRTEKKFDLRHFSLINQEKFGNIEHGSVL